MKKKGFTLIELLAVIIILAVIALIATPTILNVVENARRSAFQQSANGYYDAARYLYDELYLNNDRQDILFSFEDGEQTSSNESYKLHAKGEKPKGGVVYLASDGQIMVSIHNGKYCATTDGTGKVTISEDIENCVQNITSIPESCFEITNEPLYKVYDEFDDSEDWMSANYNTLYYTSGENCPTDIDLLVIPSEVNGEKVEAIGAQFYYTNIKSVILPSGIKVINESAFGDYGLSSGITPSLENIILPEGLIYIGAAAFLETNLKNVKLPSSLKAIGIWAFELNQLTNIEIPEGVTYIGPEAFAYNKLTNVILSEGLTTIGEFIFGDNQLTSLEIPESVTSIGDGAFSRNQLTSIIIPQSVTTIGKGAFNDNQLPDDQAFIYKRNSEGIEDKTTIISYGGAKRDNVIIPNGVTNIETSAFSSNQLTSVTIPDSVTIISNCSFQNNQFPSASAITIEGDATRFDRQWFLIGFPAK